MQRVRRAAACGALAFVLASGVVWAQAGSTAQISGTVKDPSGGVLPGVDVTVTQSDTGLKRSTVTDTGGFFTLPNLPVGPYRLDVALSGFKSHAQTGIVLQVNASPVINVVLELGAIEESVTVASEAPLVETRRSGVGEVIENARIVELPLNGRNPTDLVNIAGAAVEVEAASTRSVQGSNGGRGIAVAGGQSWGTTYILDGAMHNNPYDNLNLPLPFPDALQEFRVETGAVGASSGVHSGASVNAVTRSGTNSLHGDFFEFWRNRRFNATNAFALRGPDGKRRDDGLNRNQFGGTVGGPIVRDKLHFFGGYQQTVIRVVPTDNVAFVPTAQMLAGDFSAAASPACAGRQVPLRAPFDGANRVNPALFSRAALNLARRLPTTDDPCGRVVYGVAANEDENQPIVRLDYQWRANHTIFGRYMAYSYDKPAALASSDNILTAQFAGFDNIARSLTVGETWVLSSSVVNSVRFAWNNTDIHRFHHPFFSPTDLGINMYTYIPDATVIAVTGAFNVGSAINTEAGYKTTTYQIADDLTMVKGNHQYSFGVNLARWDSFTSANVRAMGNFTVNGQTSGLPLADFLLGQVSELIQSNPNFLDMYEWYLGLYAADTWRVGPKLTFNYGLRWEPYFPQQVKDGRIYNFVPERFDRGQKSTVFRNAPAGFVYPGDPEFVGGLSGINKRWKNFAPRVGAAWDPKGDGRMSVRGGYGLAYDFINAQYHLNTANAPPWGGDIRLTATTLDNPWAVQPGGNPFPRSFDANASFVRFGNFLAVDPDAPNVQQHSWNAGFEKQIGANVLVSASYIGNHTSNLWNMKALNPSVFLGVGACSINTPTGPQSFPVCSTTANTNQRRRLSLQNPQEGQFVAALDLHDPGGRQNYHGLLLSFQRRVRSGFDVSGNYTLSTCEGHPTQTLPNPSTGWANPDDPDYDYGPCEADRRHIGNISAGIETPQFQNRAARALASGWRINGLFRAMSGAPLSVWTGQDRALNGVGFGAAGNQRANQRPGVDPYGARTANNWLNPAAFAQPDFGTFGNSPRGGFRGPGRWQVDMVVARLVRFGGSQKVEVRVEAFNLTNNTILDNPITNFSNANFGRILQTALRTNPRVLQFGVKYGF